MLGGPAMLIGLGGGAASSMAAASRRRSLISPRCSVGNPEIQRRAQEVIDRCGAWVMTIRCTLIHDVGAGGLSNAIPEAVAHSQRGARVELRDISNDEPGMSPMEIWCNQVQERYGPVVSEAGLDTFERIARRERCPYSVVGRLTDDGILAVHDRLFGNHPVDLPIDVLLGKPPRMKRDVATLPSQSSGFSLPADRIGEAAARACASCGATSLSINSVIAA